MIEKKCTYCGGQGRVHYQKHPVPGDPKSNCHRCDGKGVVPDNLAALSKVLRLFGVPFDDAQIFPEHILRVTRGDRSNAEQLTVALSQCCSKGVLDAADLHAMRCAGFDPVHITAIPSDEDLAKLHRTTYDQIKQALLLAASGATNAPDGRSCTDACATPQS